jgi:ankyrin repeat protein/chaperone required for assembly of F1-ATPase
MLLSKRKYEEINDVYKDIEYVHNSFQNNKNNDDFILILHNTLAKYKVGGIDYCSVLNSEFKGSTLLKAVIKNKNIQVLKFLLLKQFLNTTELFDNMIDSDILEFAAKDLIQNITIPTTQQSFNYVHDSHISFNIDMSIYEWNSDIEKSDSCLHLLLSKINTVLVYMNNQNVCKFSNIMNQYLRCMHTLIINKIYKIFHLMLTYGSIFKKIQEFGNAPSQLYSIIGSDAIAVNFLIDYVQKSRNDYLHRNFINNLINRGYIVPLIKLIEKRYRTIDLIFEQDNITGFNILHFAAASGNYKCLQYLLSLQAATNCVNVKSFCGLTPLLMSVLNGRIECVRVLLNIKTINILICDPNNDTALTIALKQKRWLIADLLIRYISKELSLNLNDDLIIEKRKYIIHFCTDSLIIFESECVKIKEDMNINDQVSLVLQNIKRNKLVTNSIKFPEIEYDNDNENILPLNLWLSICAKFYNQSLLPVFKYEDTKIVDTFNLKNYDLYLAYFENVTDTMLNTMFNLGVIMSIALLTGPVNIGLSPIFFKYLLDQEISLDDFLPLSSLDEINKMEQWTNEDFSKHGINMTVTSMNSFGNNEIYELFGREIIVTKETFKIYKKAILDFYLEEGQRRKLLHEFKKGFYSFLDPQLIKSFFTVAELIKCTICIPHRISKDEWKQNSIIDLTACETKNWKNTINWFFNYIETLDAREQTKLLEFITGDCSFTFSKRKILTGYVMKIVCMPYPDVIPYTNMSRSTLYLPMYDNEDIFKKNITLALDDYQGLKRNIN